MAHWAFRLCGPIGWLVTACRFAGTISTTTIKTTDGSWHHPTRLSLSRSSCRSALTLMLLLSYCVLPFDDLGYFVEVMARCNPLDENAAGMADVEKMVEAVVVAELESAFEENPTASNVERCHVSPDADDTLSEGG
jgi:hypothetical protein